MSVAALQESEALRPPGLVMSPGRAAAAYPNALSFARVLLRKMQRERWRVAAVRVELDAAGCGEALYRVEAPGRHFYFFAISDYFPPEEKVDRSFGINWDVSAALCEGEWTDAREADLREEIPKQYEGRYDSGVLCFCRGNRSERIFDEAVAALASGTQPDAGVLASVGYLLRSTAFAGNGLFGMRPFEGLGAGHDLGAPYHVQLLCAYMLRSFVLDLVDAMALARGGVRLDRRLKRYVGVGNSAGLGLIPFLANHPRIVDRWVRTHEEALAAARRRIADREAVARYLRLAERAEAYFRQDPRDGNGVFASFARLAEELGTLRSRVGSPGVWGRVLDAAGAGLHAETVEIANGLLLEVYPDIVAAAEDGFAAEEEVPFRPAMTADDLRRLLRSEYAWVLDESDTAFFWYYPVEAPYEPRRGVRGRAPEYEHESAMDLPLRARALAAALEECAPGETAAELVARRPELLAAVARVQATAGLAYAELRQNYLSAAFTPFAACRLLLAFYGMEKYDPRPPRSTKGALLQGAPLADEIELGVEGDWPFPLIPDLRAAGSLTPLRALESPETPVTAIQALGAKEEYRIVPRDPTHIFPLELRKLLTKALQTEGCSLGVAEALAGMVQDALTLELAELDAVLDCLGECAGLPAAVDLACVKGVARVGASPLLAAAALRAGRQGVHCRVEELCAGPGPYLARGEAGEAGVIACGRTPFAATVVWDAAAIRGAVAQVDRDGFPIAPATFRRLSALAKRALVPPEVERVIAAPPASPESLPRSCPGR